MSDSKFSRSWHLLLLASILVISIVLFGMSLYKSYTCSKICISGFSQKSPYFVSAKLSYLNAPLSNSKVLVIVNHAYKTTISADSKSNLSFQAPLKIGLENIEVEYLGSTASVTFFYIGELFYVLLIPIGAVFFLIIRKFSTNLSDGDKIAFYNNDTVPTFHPEILKTALERAKENDKRAIPGLPELVRDVSKEFIGLGTKKKQTNPDSFYMCQKIEHNKLGSAYLGCVSSSPMTKDLVAARIFYEQHVNAGGLCVSPKINAQRFLKANSIIFLTDLSVPKLQSLNKKKDKIRLFLTSAADVYERARILRSYSDLSATLLILQTSFFIEINMRSD